MTSSRRDDQWRRIWQAKGETQPSGTSVLGRLLIHDGYDTGFGDVDEAGWSAHVLATMARLGASPGDSVFEAACGAGAFLYPLHRAGYAVGGLDFASTLVDVAREVMPDGDFHALPASELPEDPQVDWVLCTSAFLYFPSLAYAEGVLERMVRKARRGVLITDLPDAAFAAQSLAMREETAGGPEAYAVRYAGLDHQSYERSWIHDLAVRCGLQGIVIDDQDVPGYANAAFRFNMSGQVAAVAASGS